MLGAPLPEWATFQDVRIYINVLRNVKICDTAYLICGYQPLDCSLSEECIGVLLHDVLLGWLQLQVWVNAWLVVHGFIVAREWQGYGKPPGVYTGVTHGSGVGVTFGRPTSNLPPVTRVQPPIDVLTVGLSYET